MTIYQNDVRYCSIRVNIIYISNFLHKYAGFFREPVDSPDDLYFHRNIPIREEHMTRARLMILPTLSTFATAGCLPRDFFYRPLRR